MDKKIFKKQIIEDLTNTELVYHPTKSVQLSYDDVCSNEDNHDKIVIWLNINKDNIKEFINDLHKTLNYLYNNIYTKRVKQLEIGWVIEGDIFYRDDITIYFYQENDIYAVVGESYGYYLNNNGVIDSLWPNGLDKEQEDFAKTFSYCLLSFDKTEDIHCRVLNIHKDYSIRDTKMLMQDFVLYFDALGLLNPEEFVLLMDEFTK